MQTAMEKISFPLLALADGIPEVVLEPLVQPVVYLPRDRTPFAPLSLIDQSLHIPPQFLIQSLLVQLLLAQVPHEFEFALEAAVVLEPVDKLFFYFFELG